ncbi:unnamed protein product [Mytilus edulis]|uniref:Fibronectin type-III domain-containing protein n=1 Tax=Mytilus edulis TaxID=6550 RepID=A0A8S3TX18_MYTED|nr:unnamed protein product [Mytilus edulis]
MTETRLNISKACTAVLDLVHTSDNRKIHGKDVFQQRSSGAPGPTESSVTASISAAIDLKFITSYSSRPHQCFACGLVTQVKMKRHDLKKQLQTCKVGYRLDMASFTESTNACNTECTSNSISIDWSSLLKSLNDIDADCYAVKYKLADSKKFLMKETNDAHDNSIVLDGLKADSEYDILLFASKDGNDDKIHQTKVTTEKSVADALISSSIKVADTCDPVIYQMQPLVIKQPGEEVRWCDMISDYDKDKSEERTILLLGQTGSGKSTLIDAMINYIPGVTPADDYRLKLVHLTEAEKNERKLERKNVRREDNRDGKRTLQDRYSESGCPMFGCETRDKKTHAITEICLSSILELFAKDISDNMFILITNDDGESGEPKVLGALRDAGVPLKENMVFRFNNANLFKNESHVEWKTRNTSFKRFFDELQSIGRTSVEKSKMFWIQEKS